MPRRKKAKRRSRPRGFRLLSGIESFAYASILSQGLLGTSVVGAFTGSADIRAPLASYSGPIQYVNKDGAITLSEIVQSPDLAMMAIAANAKAIGEAAARGDLSENAEFTAALEERNLLAEKAARMEADLGKSKVIKPQMTEGDIVTVGSTIVAKRGDSGESQTMTFLGPWDSDIAKQVYSYPEGRTPPCKSIPQVERESASEASGIA